MSAVIPPICLVIVGCHRLVGIVRCHWIGDIPHIYGNFTHESKIVNAVDSFFDSIPGISICFLLGGEEAALEAVLAVIVGGGKEHYSSHLRFD